MQVPDPDLVKQTVEAHKRRVEFFEKCQCLACNGKVHLVVSQKRGTPI